MTTLILSACIPTSNENINTDLFKNKEDLKARAAAIKPGLSKAQAFAAMGIPVEKFQRMSMAEVQSSLYGNSQVQGTPDQLEQFRQRMMAIEGFALAYRELKSDGSLGFGKMKVRKTGQDLRVILIFDHDKLLRTAIEGTEDVSQQNDQYIWNSLLSKGIGFAF